MRAPRSAPATRPTTGTHASHSSSATAAPADVYLAATGDFPAELRLFYKLGVDGVFSDNSDVAVAVREEVFG